MPRWEQNPICPECGKWFNDQRAVDNHRIAKHGAQPNRPHACHCGKTFKTANALADHQHDAHGAPVPEHRKPKPFQCDRCRQSFDTAKGLDDHKSKVHKRKLRSEKFFAKQARARRNPKDRLPCPVHGLTLVFKRGPFGTYWACPKRECGECTIIGDWSDHDGKFRLSTQADRDARKLAHAAFDPLWQSCHMRRNEAYHWLAGELGIAIDDVKTHCHIKHFDEATALRVVEIVKNYVAGNQSLHDLLLTYS